MKVLSKFSAKICLSLIAISPFLHSVTIDVTSMADSGSGTLRDAIITANTNGGANTISFSGLAANSTITLSTPLPIINLNASGNTLTIDGTTTTNLTINAGSLTRIFFVDTGTVMLNSMTLMNGMAKGGNGGAGDAGGGGGLGAGAALFLANDASVIANNVTYSGNQAVGGTGGTGIGIVKGGGGGGGLGGNGGANTNVAFLAAGGGGGGGVFGAGGDTSANGSNAGGGGGGLNLSTLNSPGTPANGGAGLIGGGGGAYFLPAGDGGSGSFLSGGGGGGTVAAGSTGSTNGGDGGNSGGGGGGGEGGTTITTGGMGSGGGMTGADGTSTAGGIGGTGAASGGGAGGGGGGLGAMSTDVSGGHGGSSTIGGGGGGGSSNVSQGAGVGGSGGNGGNYGGGGGGGGTTGSSGGGSGGIGGLGGGGGGGGCASLSSNTMMAGGGVGGNGGFGGGAGGGGDGTVSGAGGGNGGVGGFGGGGGGGGTGPSGKGGTGGTGGLFGGNGGNANAGGSSGGGGGGGAGLGGAIFIQPSAQLTIIGNGTPFSGNSVVVGSGGAGSGGATSGQAKGPDLFMTSGASTTIDVPSGTLTIGSNIEGGGGGSGGGLTKIGTGTLILSGTNTYTGNTTINEGTLSIFNANIIPPASNIIFSANSTLECTSTGFFLPNTITIDTGVDATLSITTASPTFFGVINGMGTLIKQGAQTLTLSGANTYSGGTEINNGVVRISSVGNLGTGPVSFQGTAPSTTLQFTTGIPNFDLPINIAQSPNTFVQIDTPDLINASTISSVISSTSGAGGIFTKRLGGKLILSGANTYSTGTLISGGILSIGAVNNLGTGNVSINASSTLQFNSAISNFNLPISINPSVVATIDTDGNDSTISSQISTSGGALAKIGLGTLTLSGNNTYTGGTTISAGVLQISSPTGLSTGNVTDNTSLVFTSGANGTTLAQVISGTGSLTVQGGTITLSGTNSYQGGTNLDGGTLKIFNDSNLGDSSGALSFNGGALEFAADITISAGRTVTLGSGGGTFQVDPTFTGTINNAISGSGALIKTGTGILVLTGTNTYMGGTNFDAGTVQITADENLGNSSGALNFNGGTLELAASVTLSSSRTLTLSGGGGTIQVDPTFTGSYSGNIGGSGALTKTGTGILVLTGTNTYMGGTHFNAGTVQITTDENLGNSSGALNFNDGTLELAASVTLSSSRTVTLSGGGGTIQVDPTFTGSYSGNIGGSGALTKTGTGILVLTGTNTYGGGTTISSGVLEIGSMNGLSSGPVTDDASLVFLAEANGAHITQAISGSGSLTVQGGTITLSGNNTYAGGTTISGGVLEIGSMTGLSSGPVTDDASLVFLAGVTSADITQAISGSGSLTVQGGTITLSGNNTYVGGTTINGGTLAMTMTGTLDSTGAVTVNSGGTFDISGITPATSFSIGNLNGAGHIALGSKDLIADITATSTFSGIMSDGGSGGSFTKNGSAMLTLSGANTYIGGTTINMGTLALSGGGSLSSSGAVTISSGAIFNISGINPATSSSIGNLSGAGNVVLGSKNLIADVTAPSIFSGVISGGGSFTKNGGASLTLEGVNTYTGGTTINDGILALSIDGSLASSGAVTVNGGATFDISGITSTTSLSIGNLNGAGDVILGAENLTVNITAASTFSGDMSGTGGSLTKIGGATLVLSGINSYTGGTNFNGGTVSISSPSNLGTGGLNFNNGTLELTNTLTINQVVTLNSTGTIQTDGSTVGTFSNQLTGSGALVKKGGGTLVLSGTGNNYAGTTTIQNGTLRIDSATGLPTTTNVIDEGSLVFNNTGTAAVSGIISGTGTLTMEGSGVVDLTGNPGNNSYSGGTFFEAGTIKISKSTNVGTGNLTFNGGTLEIAADLTLTQTATLNAPGGGIIETDTGVTAAYTGRIMGNGSLTKTGMGNLILGTLSNPGILDSYTGGTVVSQGTLIGDTDSLPAAVGIQNNATLIFDQTFDDTYRGPISGTGTFEKTGSGTLSLSMNVSQSASTVNLGTLNLVGITMTSPLTIAAGGTLTGNGTIIGNVVNNGTVSPGNSIGIIHITGNFTSPGKLDMEIAPDGSSDQVIATGTADFTGGTLNVTAISGSYMKGQTFDIVEAASIPTDFTTINLPSNPSLTHQILLGSPNIYQLTVVNNSVFVGQTALTRNTLAVQNYLKVISAPFQAIIEEVLSNFSGFTSQQLTNALDQLQPSPSGAFDLVNLNMNHEIAYILSEHLMQPDCHKRCVVKMPEGNTENPPRTSLWVTPFGVVTRNKNVGSDMVGFRAPSGGILIGGDYCFSKHFTFGGMVGYSQAFIDWQKSRGDAHIRNQIAGVYSGYRCHRLTVDVSAFGGMNFYDITRNIRISILNRQAKSFHRGGNLASRLGANYRFNIDSFQITPFGSVESYYNYQDGYEEHSAKLLDLKVHTKVSNLLRSELGFDLKRLYNYRDGCWAPYIGVSYVRKSPLSSGKIRAGGRYFPGHFTVFTFSEAINQIAPTGGFISSWGKNGSFSGNYRAEIGQGDTVHAFEMRLAGQF